MPRRSKGPRLWLQAARRATDGRILEHPVWCILDTGGYKRSTGYGAGQAEEAQIALANYILAKGEAPRTGNRDPASIPVADVVSIYTDDKVLGQSRPKEVGARLDRILDYFGAMMLSQLNQKSCTAYVNHRGHDAAARRELEDLRAAVKHHWKQGLCSHLVPVVLPERGLERERWLTRDEVARLLWAAWRMRQSWKGEASDRLTAQHVARFILVGLYTGTRAGAICGLALQPAIGRGYVDLENGVLYRRAQGKRATKKRQPSVRLPPRLAAHLDRWVRLGLIHQAVIEWQGEAVKRISKAFRSVRKAAGLGADVTPHTLRHTCATWLAQSGAPMFESAGFLGMTVETFERVYGHHHPDHQAAAVNALSGPRQRRTGNVVRLDRRG